MQTCADDVNFALREGVVMWKALVLNVRKCCQIVKILNKMSQSCNTRVSSHSLDFFRCLINDCKLRDVYDELLQAVFDMPFSEQWCSLIRNIRMVIWVSLERVLHLLSGIPIVFTTGCISYAYYPLFSGLPFSGTPCNRD